MCKDQTESLQKEKFSQTFLFVSQCACSLIVEPRLSLQWFVKVAPLAKAAADAVRDGRVKIEPKEMEPRYFEWVDNMHDWCISRQLWWGHRIPVWYGPNGEVLVVGADEKAPDGYTQDPDVLDTWFSSALWPFSTLGWPANSDDLKKFYPTSVLVTGYEPFLTPPSLNGQVSSGGNDQGDNR